MAMIRPKSQKFKIGYDDILSIGNFILMIKNHISLFQLPGNWPTTKKCAHYFRGNTKFPIYFHVLWLFIGKKHDLGKKKSKFLKWNQYFQYIPYMLKVKIGSTAIVMSSVRPFVCALFFGPSPKKMCFSIRIEHVRAPSSSFERSQHKESFFYIGSMVIYACGLLLTPAKVPNFQYRAWLCSMDQKFHVDDEKIWYSLFWDLTQWLKAKIRPKSRNSNIRHDDILTIGNFMLMINNHFALFKLPGNLSLSFDKSFHQENVLPISVATRNFYLLFFVLLVFTF
jgi:hypothetical protein